jgi:hypothetical protein
MTLRNVTYVRVRDMTTEQRKEYDIQETEGLVAIETHNTEYKRKAVKLENGLSNYILNGE